MNEHRRGTDHIRRKVENDEESGLTEEEAKEQLQYELRNQLGELTFETKHNENEWERGDGVVIAKINGREVDHYIFHEK